MNFNYAVNYDSQLLRGTEIAHRPWNLTDEILKYKNKKNKLLDIGCGTAFKLIPLAKHFAQIIGIDIVYSMIEAAKNNFIEHKIINGLFIVGNNEKLPFILIALENEKFYLRGFAEKHSNSSENI